MEWALPSRRDPAQLLKQTQQVRFRPLLDDLSVGKALDKHPGVDDLLARWGKAKRIAQMCPLKVITHGDFIPAGDYVIDAEAEVRKSGSYPADKLLVLLPSLSFVRIEIMANKMRIEQLVRHTEIAPMPHLVPNTLGDTHVQLFHG
jgi:hypothetical protein